MSFSTCFSFFASALCGLCVRVFSGIGEGILTQRAQSWDAKGDEENGWFLGRGTPKRVRNAITRRQECQRYGLV